MKSADFSVFSRPGTTFEVRVTPKAARNAVTLDEAGKLRVTVTAVPEGGKANTAVLRLLSKALGVPKSRIALLRGATSRDKTFRIAE
ncbi:DUF167 domain-containing protein [Antarctobacter jejuensis]|uniref:DUF167 domain-containing protein n=1 Tax=Antarctobacter jejuensis TaxID=1439938 RepID=UPI003FD50845